MIDRLRIPSFFDAATCARIVAELRAAEGTPAAVYGGPSARGIRHTTRVAASPATATFVRDALAARMDEAAAHFGATLQSVEEPQFLRYDAGDFFVAHQDGNTPLLRDETMHRRVSAVVFLNDGYRGGELLFHDGNTRVPADPAPGTLLLFRAETTHEVTPLVEGVRFSIASWFR
jgi:SM-20-related protein